MKIASDSSLQRFMGNSWLGAILALLELVLGFAMLSFPFILGTAAVWVAGFMLVFLACVHAWHVITRKGHRIWSLLSAVLYCAIGRWCSALDYRHCHAEGDGECVALFQWRDIADSRYYGFMELA